MAWYKHNGKVLKIGGAIAVSQACCCWNPCCRNTLTTGDILDAEVISDTTGCFPVGTKIELNDSVSPEIWSSNGVSLSPPDWMGLYLACDTRGTPETDDDQLVLHWEFILGSSNCPEVDTCSDPIAAAYCWVLESGTCTPRINAIYYYDLAEVAPPSACPCLTGRVRVRVTERAPP